MPIYIIFTPILVSLFQEYAMHVPEVEMHTNKTTKPLIYNSVLPVTHASTMMAQTCKKEQPITNLTEDPV